MVLYTSAKSLHVPLLLSADVSLSLVSLPDPLVSAVLTCPCIRLALQGVPTLTDAAGLQEKRRKDKEGSDKVAKKKAKKEKAATAAPAAPSPAPAAPPVPAADAPTKKKKKNKDKAKNTE